MPTTGEMRMTKHAAATVDVVDPVCGMTITPADAVGHVDYRGQTYYFCSAHCKQQFDQDPARYTGQGTSQR